MRRFALVFFAGVALGTASISFVACSSKSEPDPVVVDTGVDTGPACIAYDAGPAAPPPPKDTGPMLDDDGIPIDPPDAKPDLGPDTGAPISRAVIDDIFERSCSFSSCHGSSPGQGKLYLPPKIKSDWYPQLINKESTELPRMKRVVPGDPGNSWLVYKLQGSGLCAFAKECVGGTKELPCGDRMPEKNEALPAEDFNKIVKWIYQGASEK